MNKAQKAYDKIINQAGDDYMGVREKVEGEYFATMRQAEDLRDTTVGQAWRTHEQTIADAKHFLEATTIERALDVLVDFECPYCHIELDLPSLEDIQEWLKEEK